VGYKNVAIFDQQLAISQKRLKIDGYMQRGVLQALNPLSNGVTFTAMSQGHTQGKAKCGKKNFQLKLRGNG